ncbi:MAG TPA: serine hydrolase domain-containing protein [Opitutaceae bacterium]|nr:serine hydrolase domain-containing protein [Opitutaceae bacterium]
MITACRLAVLAAAAALPLPADPIDDHVVHELPRLHLPGLALAIVRDGEVIKAAGYGRADLEHDVPVTSAQAFEIGSLTKQFTATAVMMLAEEGRLRLDDSIRRHLRDAPSAWEPITLRHLLTHCAGIRNHVALPEFMAELFRGPLARDELLRRFYALPLEFAPGETWAYDNTGYILLGFVIEDCSGEDLWRFFERRIFGPLGMRHTGPNQPPAPGDVRGYGWENGRYLPRPALPAHVARAAGGLQSTVGDLARWEAALAGGRLLKPESFRELWTPARGRGGALLPVNYGFGWFLENYGRTPIIQHGGGTPGFSASFYRFPDRKLAVVLLANRGDRILDQLALDVAALADQELARPMPDIVIDDTDRFRTVLESLLAGRPDPAAFSPEMNRFLQTTIGRGWYEWIASHGALGEFRYLRQADAADGRTWHFRGTLSETGYYFTFRTDRSGRVAQVNAW